MAGRGKRYHTFAILDRRNDRIRNLRRSSSVWVTIRLKFEDGSMVEVISSTVSIYSCRGLAFFFLSSVLRVLVVDL